MAGNPRYQKAFALRDNPFSPTIPPEGIGNPALMQMLECRPLQICKEPKLMDLYCPAAGPFKKNVDRFLDIIALKGYTIDPPNKGIYSFILFIDGDKGTGKTTLMNIMVHHLKICTGNAIKIFEEPQIRDDTPANEQITAIKSLGDSIKKNTNPGDYVCIIIDDLLKEAFYFALELFNTFSSNHIVFLFLITSDLTIRNKNDFNSTYSIEFFKMESFNPDYCLALVKHRIEMYRDKDINGKYQLFPFEANDIKEAMEEKKFPVVIQEGRPLTIRMFCQMFSNFIQSKVIELGSDFDITKVDNLDAYIIRLVEDYGRLVAR